MIEQESYDSGYENGIRLACKAVCQWCAEVGPPHLNSTGCWRHKMDKGEPTEPCKADQILEAAHALPEGTLGWTPTTELEAKRA